MPRRSTRKPKVLVSPPATRSRRGRKGVQNFLDAPEESASSEAENSPTAPPVASQKRKTTSNDDGPKPAPFNWADEKGKSGENSWVPTGESLFGKSIRAAGPFNPGVDTLLPSPKGPHVFGEPRRAADDVLPRMEGSHLFGKPRRAADDILPSTEVPSLFGKYKRAADPTGGSHLLGQLRRAAGPVNPGAGDGLPSTMFPQPSRDGKPTHMCDLPFLSDGDALRVAVKEFRSLHLKYNRGIFIHLEGEEWKNRYYEFVMRQMGLKKLKVKT
ncbi:hypothetical protein EJ06DRAFT_582034 [Trichodelitschia bisporula]|uniref:Uncharacterized protein n=1 Tax=Trichodelitschia bisporula TaxID=703511 RepID=A0A6G1HYM9_9PEZI|nr:hypothetical protein EJ06DRAFT_582034 [Trichodelitschia bisporula]